MNNNLNLEVIENEENYDTYSSSDSSYSSGNEMKLVIVEKNEKYKDKSFIGVKAYCHNRAEDRVFRVDRILKLNIKRRSYICIVRFFKKLFSH